jgi:hypothetical protein
MSPKIADQIGSRSTITFTATLFIAALFSCLASYSHACAVDGATQTDTTITISWDVSGCKRLSAGATFRVCWKNAANSGNACLPPTLDGYGETGTTTITGLSPSTAYRIRTLWHQRSWGWLDVTTRTVTTNPTQAASSFSLRYEKDIGHPYRVVFFWKNIPTLTVPISSINLVFSRKLLSGWILVDKSPDVTTVVRNPITGEYSFAWDKFYESRTYKAIVNVYAGNNSPAASSNEVQWH